MQVLLCKDTASANLRCSVYADHESAAAAASALAKPKEERPEDSSPKPRARTTAAIMQEAMAEKSITKQKDLEIRERKVQLAEDRHRDSIQQQEADR